MTKLEFMKEVKRKINTDGAKPVDFNIEKDDDGLYIAVVIAIRNHIPYMYEAYESHVTGLNVNYVGSCKPNFETRNAI